MYPLEESVEMIRKRWFLEKFGSERTDAFYAWSKLDIGAAKCPISDVEISQALSGERHVQANH
jgi:hypothetical protein